MPQAYLQLPPFFGPHIYSQFKYTRTSCILIIPPTRTSHRCATPAFSHLLPTGNSPFSHLPLVCTSPYSHLLSAYSHLPPNRTSRLHASHNYSPTYWNLPPTRNSCVLAPHSYSRLAPTRQSCVLTPHGYSQFSSIRILCLLAPPACSNSRLIALHAYTHLTTTRPPTEASHLLATPAYSHLTPTHTLLLFASFAHSQSRLLILDIYSQLAPTSTARLFASRGYSQLPPICPRTSTRTPAVYSHLTPTCNLFTFTRWPLSFLGVWGLGVAARQTALDTVPLGDASDAWVRELPTTAGRQPLTLPDGNASANVLRAEEISYLGIPTCALDCSLAPSVLHNQSHFQLSSLCFV